VRFLLAILAASLFLPGCPKPTPIPVVPADPTCGLSTTEHDDLVDDAVGDLQGLDPTLTVELARYAKSTVQCVVDEIIGDVHNAPDLTAAATAWRQANP
jgi:hypothetical protein